MGGIIPNNCLLLVACILVALLLGSLCLYRNYKNLITTILVLLVLAGIYSLSINDVIIIDLNNQLDFLARLSIDWHKWLLYFVISGLSVIPISLFMIEIGNKVEK